MTVIRTLTLTCAIVLLLAAASAALADEAILDVEVSPEAGLPSVVAEAIAQAGRSGQRGVRIHLAPGRYRLKTSVRLDLKNTSMESVEISGSSQAPSILCGGRKLPAFRVPDEATRNALPSTSRQNARQVDLRDAGIDAFGEIQPRGFSMPGKAAPLELFFAGRPMPLAGYPNAGWIDITDEVKGRKNRFGYDDSHLNQLTTQDDAWLHGYWRYNWADSWVKLDRIDAEKQQIVTHSPHGIFGYRKGGRFRVVNVLAELDAPGEWHLDGKTGKLTFYPPAADGDAFVSMLEDPLLAVYGNGATKVRLQHLTVEHGRGGGMVIVNAPVEVLDSTFRNLGRKGIYVDSDQPVVVRNCHLAGLGECGAWLHGGDRKTLTPAGHRAENNHIHDVGRWVRSYQPGLRLSGVGHHAENNRIHDTPHAAIIFKGNDHVIRGNDIRRVCLETGDAGALYTGRDWTQRGTVIEQNLFLDIEGVGEKGARAVYLDDLASGAVVRRNVLRRCRWGVYIGGGRDNVIEANWFDNCQAAVHVDARGIGWAKPLIEQGKGSWDLYGKLAEVRHKQPPYATRYPPLAEILDHQPQKPLGNRIADNLATDCETWLDLQGVEKAWLTLENNRIAETLPPEDQLPPWWAELQHDPSASKSSVPTAERE